MRRPKSGHGVSDPVERGSHRRRAAMPLQRSKIDTFEHQKRLVSERAEQKRRSGSIPLRRAALARLPLPL